MNNEENKFDFIDKNEKSLVEERVAWQSEHPKPWYLRPQLKSNSTK
jgi:hypothetical protein